MRSSFLNLIIGVVWCFIWVYHTKTLWSEHKFLEALFEFSMSLPIGAGFVLDWALYGRLGKPNFLIQKKWNICDYLIFASGAIGILSIVLIWVLKLEMQDIQLMGVIVVAIAATHYLRRQIRKRLLGGSI